ncbi:MAG: tetratricopeptide repeat protein [Chitinophagaceae bacterium]|nr:tetratricopeptide repeat protein [Chitinophagaceae bacterium]
MYPVAKKIFITCFHFFIALFAVAQLPSHEADSAYVFGLINKAEVFFTDASYDSALYYCDKAEVYSHKVNFRKGIAYALIEKTDVYIDMDKLDKATLYPSRTEAIGQQLRDSLITAIAWMQAGQISMYNNQPDEAITFLSKSLQYYLDRHPSRYSALAFNDLGYTWGLKGELSKKATCLIQSISIYETHFPEQYGELGIALNNLSTVYYELGQIDKAIEYAKRSLVYREKTGDIARLAIGCCNISQFYAGRNNEEAEKYLQLCVKYAGQTGQEQRIIHSYITASKLYAANKKPKEALDYELKSIALLEKSKKDIAMLANRYVAAAILSRQLNKDTAEVMSYFKKSEQLLSLHNNKAQFRDYYQQLSVFYKDNGNYGAAYDTYKKYIAYRDSLVNQNTASAIAEINTRYETEKKDNEITRLNAGQRIKQLEIEKQKALIAGNRLEALQKENEIVLLSKSKELQDVKIKQQDEELEKQMLLTKNNEQALKLSQQEKELREKELLSQKLFRNIMIAGIALLALLAAVLFNRYQLKRKLQQQTALQTMRNNIARDLHDDIGASLSNINILNELAKRHAETPVKSHEYLDRAGEDIQRISESLSDIVWNISPKYDDMRNLFIRMKRYAADMFDGRGIHYEIILPEEAEKVSLPMERRRDLYLIFKEAVNNLVKYSKATSARLVVEADGGKVLMSVVDNGVGFNSLETQYGNGIANMKKRAEAWNDTLLVKSHPGKGTEVKLEMSIT